MLEEELDRFASPKAAPEQVQDTVDTAAMLVVSSEHVSYIRIYTKFLARSSCTAASEAWRVISRV